MSAKSESKNNEFQKIGQAVPDQSFSEQSGLQEIQKTLSVTSFDATLNAPKMVHELSETLAGKFSLGWSPSTKYWLISEKLKELLVADRLSVENRKFKTGVMPNKWYK